MTKNFTTKAAKVLTIATLSAGTLIGAVALDTTTVSASSVSQISGDELKGKIQAVTNSFPTFESAQAFVTGQMSQMLFGESYRAVVIPENSLYIVEVTIDYDALTSKDQAIALANQVVAAADSAIGGAAPATPAEPETPVTSEEPTTPVEPETPVTPVEPTTPTEPETPVTSVEPTTPIEVSKNQKSSTTKEEIKKVIPDNSTEAIKKDVKTLPNTGDAGSVLSIIGSGLLSLGGYVALKRKN
ncbi:TPA: LPXTG cell wall anchor domain-containing protein [Streptococcus suis]|uniref:LPXTG cell wall anchor domain-containing protein n=2 Tax=Bacteria TaxID=2 RepID=A0AAP6A684_STRSU|nr:LPXTG cell wall anchor domain-containing protein [Streptococcus suis]AER17384.1 LPXTG-motif cell wall anchor domain protein [Streptococcus suis D9]MBS8061319.1 LPXTG cell wall anchor domain-containing protein [Streptococcus suis]MBS8065418.1 LPXTG cell wall anchor domain-containing protein [Streptococcus suis]MCB2855551.1 LPXTG cell wall anchor domain-containing protein [Streptococcus suis]MCB2857385.1 LPXTG cell wall anchor domain-containing protein [Streptococcus suis]